MKKLISLVLAVGMVIALAQIGFAQAQKATGDDGQKADAVKVEAEENTATATVDAIDYESGTGTLKLSDGTMLTFIARPEMREFSRLKVGDQVIIRR